MQIDFAALLVIATVITGIICLLDVLLWAPKRAKAGAAAAGQTQKNPGKSKGQVYIKAEQAAANVPWYIDFSRSFFPVILAVLILRSFLVEPFRIPSGSMEPTLLPGDFILVNKFSYGLRLPVAHTKIVPLGEPERGDVVVFRYPEDPKTAFIKRIVGLPGDRLAYRDKQLYINGEPAMQTLVDNSQQGQYEDRLEDLGNMEHLIKIRQDGRSEQGEWLVPTGHYFTLGDNRDNSRDSRYWKFLPEENLIGKAFLIWMNSDCVFFKGNCNRIGSKIE